MARTTATVHAIPTLETKPQPIRLLLPSLDEEGGSPVLRGVLDVDTLPYLKIDTSYQREGLSSAARKEIRRALENNKKLPDIELGMRGDRFEMPDNETAILLDPVYIMDGQQRRNTVVEHVSRFPESHVRLGAVVHFNTDREFEAERFIALNLFRSRVAPSVMLKTYKEKNLFVATLYGLSTQQRDSAVFGRVSWSQHKNRGEVLTGLVYAQIALELHARFTGVSNRVNEIPAMGEALLIKISLANVRHNLSTFWETIDQVWGLRKISTAATAVHLRMNFLRTLARTFSDYRDFWEPNGRQLAVPPELKAKLRKLDLGDEEIVRLAGASGAAAVTLSFQLIKHLNSGKRTKILRPWGADLVAEASHAAA